MQGPASTLRIELWHLEEIHRTGEIRPTVVASGLPSKEAAVVEAWHCGPGFYAACDKTGNLLGITIGPMHYPGLEELLEAPQYLSLGLLPEEITQLAGG